MLDNKTLAPSLEENDKKRTVADLLTGLNEVQCQAVTHTQGPLLLVAGAGSGKTRVITHRIAYLIHQHHVKPWNIAAVTFTNKAAQEMRLRLGHLVGSQARNVFVRTFHSLGLYILSRHPEKLGLQSGFSIIDQSGQKSLLKTILKEERMERDALQPAIVANQINTARDAMLSPASMSKSDNVYAQDIGYLYDAYIKRLRKNNSLDFGDLLYETVRLFEKDQEIHSNYAKLWQHFLIDEYQDTNRTQYLLGRMIAQGHQNIMVVGDDDQSIYSWRGADIQNILSFENDYPKAKILRLEENYRSTPTILKAASSLISNNLNRRHKTLFTKRPNTSPIFLYAYNDEHEEGRQIAQQILAYKSQGISLNQIAIFYRTNAQSRIFERILREKNLPYIIVGDIRFYERKEIKDLLAYLSVIVNPHDDISLERIINVPPRGIGKTTLEHLHDLGQKNNQSLIETLGSAGQSTKLRSAQKLGALHKLLVSWQRLYQNQELPSLIAEQVLQESGYVDALKKEGAFSYEAAGRLENLYEFIASIRQYEREYQEGDLGTYDPGSDIDPWDYGTSGNSDKTEAKTTENTESHMKKTSSNQPNLADFLQQISLYTDEKSADQGRSSYLSLMTLHNAKGLEFPYVFLCGLEEGYLPHGLSIEEGNIEEERRLLYVGITRAKECLHLSHVHQRWVFGNLQSRRASSFIEEIDPSVFA